MIVAFLGSNVAGSLHEATVSHTRCAEHGELMHMPAEAGPAGAVAEHTAGHAVKGTTPGDTGAHEHEHCYLCPSSREREGVTLTGGLAADSVAPSLQPAQARDQAPASSLLYVLAPKTSPPV